MIVRRASGRLVVVAAASAALLLAACGDDASSDATLAGAPPLTSLSAGDPLAARELPVLAAADAPEAGATLDLGALGGPAVVNFWATWCAFCVEEMPAFQAVHEAVGDQVRFIGVDREDNVEAALSFLSDVGVTYETVEDVDGSYFTAVKGRGMPTTLFVDGDGIIRYRHAGPMTGEQLRGFIAQYLEVQALR